MLLDDTLALEMDIDILSYLDLKSLMNILLMKRVNYHTFHNYILKDSMPHFNFTETKWFHRAIMFNKYYILKWMIKNNILSTSHTILCQYYMKTSPSHDYMIRRSEQLDISLALACHFADDKIYDLLVCHKPIRPIINSYYFSYIEYLIADKRGDYRKKMHIEQHMKIHDGKNSSTKPMYKKSSHIKYKLKQLINGSSGHNYCQFFIDAMNYYRITDKWDLKVPIILPDTSQQ